MHVIHGSASDGHSRLRELSETSSLTIWWVHYWNCFNENMEKVWFACCIIHMCQRTFRMCIHTFVGGTAICINLNLVFSELKLHIFANHFILLTSRNYITNQDVGTQMSVTYVDNSRSTGAGAHCGRGSASGLDSCARRLQSHRFNIIVYAASTVSATNDPTVMPCHVSRK